MEPKKAGWTAKKQAQAVASKCDISDRLPFKEIQDRHQPRIAIGQIGPGHRLAGGLLEFVPHSLEGTPPDHLDLMNFAQVVGFSIFACPLNGQRLYFSRSKNWFTSPAANWV
jgi:hypothetical protein